MKRLRLAAAGVLFACAGPAVATEPVYLHAAGSLRAALTEAVALFEKKPGTGKVVAKFGPSGLLRDEIAGGAKAEVFASANLEHPRSLAEAGKAGPVVLFARNRLCALAAPNLTVTSATLVDRMLDPAVKLGTSTPKADPSGDYAWALFRRIDRMRPGSFELLDRKALQLTGGPTSPAPPPGRNPYGAVVAEGRADLFLTYCTNAKAAAAEVAGVSVVDLAETLAVGADYGLTVVAGASARAYNLALFILSPDGQAVLARHGFAAPTTPAEEKP